MIPINQCIVHPRLLVMWINITSFAPIWYHSIQYSYSILAIYEKTNHQYNNHARHVQREKPTTMLVNVSSSKLKTSTTLQSTEWSFDSQTKTSSLKSSTLKSTVITSCVLLMPMNCLDMASLTVLPTGLPLIASVSCLLVVSSPSLAWLINMKVCTRRAISLIAARSDCLALSSYHAELTIHQLQNQSINYKRN